MSDVQTRNDAGSQLGDPYKMHALDQMDLVAALQEGISPSEIMSVEYVWVVSTHDIEAIRVDKVDGEWTVLGYSTPRIRECHHRLNPDGYGKQRGLDAFGGDK